MPDIGRRRVLSATSPSPLLKNSNRVEDLGCFDEESCRFFLREVGERVVQCYPFSFGMEEVYSLILERYGYAGLPDATSVLQDLLEDEGAAGGFGDDGDIWRSWRHSWRHRNDDSLNPFIPKVGNFVLQQPTQQHIRLLKAQNFIRNAERKTQKVENASSRQSRRTPWGERSLNQVQSQSPTECETKLKDLEATENYQLPATTYSHQRTRALQASEHGSSPTHSSRAPQPSTARDSDKTERSPRGSSQQEFAEVTPTTLELDIDPSLLVSFEMLSTGLLSSDQTPTLRGGQGDIYTLRQVGSSDDTEAMARDSALADTSHSTQKILNSISHPATEAASAGAELDGGGSSSSRDMMFVEDKEASKEPLGQDKLAESQLELFSNVKPLARFPLGDSSGPSRRRRAINREARLIDGEIVTSRTRKRLSSLSSILAVDEAQVEESKVSTVRRSWTPVWQRRDSRSSSWMQTMRKIFRTDSNSSQGRESKQSTRTTSQPPIPNLVVSQSHHITENNPSTSEQSRTAYPLGLDGTFDRRSFVPNPRMDYNKPLPLSPGEIVRSLSALPKLPLFRQPRDPPKVSSTAAPVSRAHTSANMKLDPQPVHRSKRPDVPLKHQLLPACAVEDLSEKPTADPEKATQPPLSAITYSSIAKLNPFNSNPVAPVTLPPVSAPAPLFAIRDEPATMAPVQRPMAVDESITNWLRRKYPNFCVPSPEQIKQGHLSEWKSLSPVKNFVTGKRKELKEFNVNMVAPPQLPLPLPPKNVRKSSLRKLSNFLKHPFVSQPPTDEEKIAKWMADNAEASKPQPTVSLDPATQARILADLELVLVTTVNNFLINMANSQRLCPEIVMRFSNDWKARGFPPVVEFLYDCRTQYALVIANWYRVQFHDKYHHNIFARDSAVQAWAAIVQDLSVHSFCLPDQVIISRLYEMPNVLTMLGASEKALAAVGDLKLKTQEKIGRRKAAIFTKREGPFRPRVPRWGDGLYHKRDLSVDSALDAYEGIEAAVANMPVAPSMALVDGPGPSVRKHDRIGVL